MAKIWKETYDSSRHTNRMLGFATPTSEYSKAPSLIPYDVFFVSVCSFTFGFHSVEQIEACLDFYSQKTHPSSRINIGGADHWEAQHWFEQLPMYLLEEPKRRKVVKALEEAVKEFKNN